MKKTLVLSLGSNMGNRYAYLVQAIERLFDLFDTVGQIARYYETPPWGNLNQSRFLNTVVVLETLHTSARCLDILQSIETGMGRKKNIHWGPRIIDLDILFYDDAVMSNANLTLPHPHLHERAFVLAPLCDLIPNWPHPTLHKTMTQLLKNIQNDTLIFKP